MKVKNIRNKVRSIQFPIGVASRAKVKKIELVGPGQEIELSEEDAYALARLERQIGVPVDLRTKADPALWGWQLEGEDLASGQHLDIQPLNALTEGKESIETSAVDGDATIEMPSGVQAEAESATDDEQTAKAEEGGAGPSHKKKRGGKRQHHKKRSGSRRR